MAHAIKTVLTYNLDGATKDFNIPFEYLARKFVVVTLIGVDRKVLVLNQDYRFATRTTISTTLAWGQTQGYTQIELRRYTSATERLVDFTDGSILRAYDLNVAQVQTLHVAEEARDLTADTIGVNNDGHLDARGRRIVNVANAVDDRDAVPFGQLKEMSTGAWQARNQAETFKNQAQGFRDEAEVSRNAAEAAKARAGASELKAKDWAVKMDGPVETVGDLWSAKRYSELASTDRANAAVSANAAAADAQTAKEHGNRAQTYSNAARAARDEATAQADRAKTEADKLGNMNALGGAIDEVAGVNVRWKGEQQGKKTVAAYTEVDKSHRMRMTTWEDNDFVVGDLAMDQPNGVTFATLAAHKSDASRHQMTLQRLVVADNVIESNADDKISHAWADQYHTKAPFFQRINVQSTSSYHPIVKQTTFQAGRWGGTWSIGMLLTGAQPSYHVFAIDESGNSKLWDFRWDGTFAAPGMVHGATGVTSGGNITAASEVFVGGGVSKLASDGNIYGGIWGNDWLTNYLNRTFKKKTKGWTSVWSGHLPGGQVAWLSQDIRFRTIWIRCASQPYTWTPIKIGPDGQYMIRPDPGWMRFTVSSNGTAITNLQDDNSVPLEIVVENE